MLANHLEGKSYKLYSYGKGTVKFGFNSGRGMIEIHEHGVSDYVNKKYQEHICLSKPIVYAKNLIFGGLYVDIEGETQALNVTTGEKVVMNHY